MDKEYFYFGIKKAFKPFSYDIERIDEASFLNGNFEYTVKAYYGPGLRGGYTFTPELEIFKNGSSLNKIEINGLNFSARTTGDGHHQSYNERAWILLKMEYFDENENYCSYCQNKNYTSSLKDAVEMYFHFITFFSVFKDVKYYEAYERLTDYELYSDLSGQKVCNIINDLKLLWSFIQKDDLDQSFVRWVKKILESTFEKMKEEIANMKFETITR